MRKQPLIHQCVFERVLFLLFIMAICVILSAPIAHGAGESEKPGSQGLADPSESVKESNESETNAAEMEQKVQENTSVVGDDFPEGVEQAAYPGVTNKLISRDNPGKPSIKLYYPAFGNALVDEALQKWMEDRLAYYDDLVKDSGVDSVEADNGEASESETDNPENWEMTGFYTLERPLPNIASLLFNIYAYTGGAHGNVWLYSQNYDLESGNQINFNDLFAKPEKALELMSRISIEKLRAAIGEDTDEEWLERGAGPDMENFSVLTLVPDGLYVEFQPYQVGPWAIGPQRVHLSLKELIDAQPSAKIWKLPEIEQNDAIKNDAVKNEENTETE